MIKIDNTDNLFQILEETLKYLCFETTGLVYFYSVNFSFIFFSW